MRNSDTQPTPKHYPRIDVRLGDLAAPLAKQIAIESKATGQQITPSTIIKRSLRAYLNGRDMEHIQDMAGMIKAVTGLRSDLARVGGNLNQLAYSFNIYNQVDETELQKCHEELRDEFGKVITTLRGIERELYKCR